MADIIVNPGATSSNITLNDAQNMFVMNTGVANNTTVNEDSYIYVSSGGIVNDTVINDWGGVELSGTANKTVVNAGGNVTVYSKGKAIGTVVNGGMQVSSGGIASDTTVSTGGMYVFERGRIQGSTIVNQGGTATFEGGVYTAGIAVHGGMLILKSSTESEEHAGCDFNGIAIDSGGSLIISAGATASSATVGNGSVTVRKGGTLENSILTNASVAVSGGAIVSSINLKEGAVMNVASDGTLRNVNVSAGGVLTGVLREASQLKFYGGTLNLNISGTSPDGEFIIDEQSFGAILEDGYLCTLTVSGTQADGTYNLIEDAAGFDKTITVVNTSGTTLGTISVEDGTKKIGDVYYTLALDDSSNLIVTLGDITPPTISNIAADITAPTNQNVTVTADFSDNVEVASKQYRIGDGAWTAYPAGGVVMTVNGTVYFKAVDTFGNESEVVSYEVANIDKEDPIIKNITPSTTDPAESVTVTADFYDAVELASKQYNLGGGAWQDYDPAVGVTVTENTTVNFLATDTAGNTATDSYEVTNIGGGVDLTGDLSTSFELTAGMVGSSVNILLGGDLDVLNGGFTSQTTVNSGGDLAVSEGGVADVVTVNFGGDLFVWFGGKATLVKENGGFVFVNDGATVTFVPNSFDGYVYNNSEDWCTIHSGTIGTDLTVGNDGGIEVHSGGTAVDTTVAADGIFYVYSGGTATDTTVASDGLFYVFSGGTATGIVAEAGAYLMLTAASGTYAQGTYAGSAFEIVENATDFTVHDKVTLDVLSDGTAADTTVAAGGIFRVQSGGTAADTTVAADGYLKVWAGGTATGIVAVDGARLELTVAPGTYQKGTYAGSAFEITDTVTDFTVHSGGGLYVSAGGSADVVTVNFGGDLYVRNGGVATLVKENGGYAGVQDGATVTFVPNSFGGYVYNGNDLATIHSGTTGTNLTAANEGRIYVYSGGIASTTAVNKNGWIVVYEGGTANNTTVNEGGDLFVSSGGTAADTTVTANGYISAYAGGKLTGKVTIETGANVIVEDGAIVDFDLTQTTAGADALVNDLSFFKGVAVKYTLTVDGTQASGAYKLAGNVASFNKIISVKSVLGEDYGYLTFGGTLSTSFADYTLALADDNTLTVDVVSKAPADTTPPEVVNVMADITDPTNGNVTVTADFTDNVAVAYKYYKLIKESLWLDYDPATGVVMTENGTVYFEAVDTSGNTSDVVTCTVTNIDKEAPTITGITPSTTAPATSVTVTADFYDAVELASKQYNLGGGAWQDYDPAVGVTVTENTTVNFLATDTAGNETTESYEVTNIQPVVPDNGPAEPKNNTLYLDKWNVNTDVTEAYGTHLTAAGQEVFLDLTGTVDEGGYHNSVDRDDTIDYAKIVLEHGANLSFHAESTAAATFTVYSLTQNAKTKKYTLKKLQTLKLADKDRDGVFTADSSKLLSLSVSGAYYVSMQFTDKDKSKTAYYNVTLNGEGSKKPSEFYNLGDNSDDWGDMKTAGYGGAVGDIGVITDETIYPVSGEWAGFGDKVDYKKFTLASAAELSLSVSAQDGPLKLSVCRLKETTSKKGVTTYSQVTIKSLTVKAGQSKPLNSLRLAAGDYFFKVESTNVKKSTGYNVQITNSDFYTDGDDGWNNVLLDGKKLNENVQYFYDNALSVSGAIHLDKDGDYKTSGVAAEYIYGEETYGGFVCFGDETDFAKLTVSQTSKVTFTLSATNDATLEVIKVTQNGEKYTKKSLQTVKYKAGSDPASSKKAVTLEVKDGVSYYVSVKATNTRKTSVDPKTYYNVSYALEPVEAAALSMPETVSVASALSMPETASPASALEMPMAAAAYIDSVQDKLFGETGNGLLASL